MHKPISILFVVAVLSACGTPAGTGGTGGGSAGSACTQATLFAGSPNHNDPMARPSEGTGLLEDPPLGYRTLVFSNGQVITHTGQEIWRANLSDSKLHRVAGVESVQQALITGACATARFGNIFGIALASDGSLYVSDQTANAILKVTDPLGAGCMVSHIAGTPTDKMPGDFSPGSPPNVGNVDGAGAMAKFGLPERLGIDGSDNLYVWDNGNNSIRKIANDAMHTVSTIIPSVVPGGGAVISNTFMGGKLYTYGGDGNDVFLMTTDASGMGKTDLFRGRADLFGGDTSDSQTIGGITNDGSKVYVFFNGQLFAIGADGKPGTALAGVYKPSLDFSSGYDPKASHPADKVELVTLGMVSTAGINAFLAVDSKKSLYVSADVVNHYVEKIDCP